MKDPNVEALNKRTRTDVIITMILSGVFAVYTVIKLFQHAPDAACSGKQVQHVNPLQIHTVVEQIEQTLLGKVRRGPCGDIFRGRQSPPPIYAGDDSHYSQLPALLFGA